MPFAELTVTGAATRLEGPLLFLERTVRVGLNSAVEVIGADGVARTGRVALPKLDRGARLRAVNPTPTTGKAG